MPLIELQAKSGRSFARYGNDILHMKDGQRLFIKLVEEDPYLQ